MPIKSVYYSLLNSLPYAYIYYTYLVYYDYSVAIFYVCPVCLAYLVCYDHLLYSGKVWRGESLANLANRLRFAKLKPSKLVVTIDNPLADPFIRQTFFRQMLEKRFAKLSARQTFPLYGIPVLLI